MADILVGFSETRGYYTPTVKVDILFSKDVEQSELISFMLKFVKCNIYKILRCSKISLNRRLKIACMIFMGSNLYEIIMKLKYRKYLNDK